MARKIALQEAKHCPAQLRSHIGRDASPVSYISRTSDCGAVHLLTHGMVGSWHLARGVRAAVAMSHSVGVICHSAAVNGVIESLTKDMVSSRGIAVAKRLQSE
jgi:hypothetical protein